MLRTVKVLQGPPQGHCAHQSWEGSAGHFGAGGTDRGRPAATDLAAVWRVWGGTHMFGTWLNGDVSMSQLCDSSVPAATPALAAARSPAGTLWMSPGRMEARAGLGFGPLALLCSVPAQSIQGSQTELSVASPPCSAPSFLSFSDIMESN